MIFFSRLFFGSANLKIDSAEPPVCFHCVQITPSLRSTPAQRQTRLLISDALPFGGLWYTKQDDAIDYAEFFSRSHDAVIGVYDEAGNVIETHEHKGEFKEW